MGNPITSVTPVDFFGTPTGAAVSNLPNPAKYEYDLRDVSSQYAGNTEAGVFNKMRLGQSIGIYLSWKMVTVSECASILSAFNSEYVLVDYLDARSGSSQQKVFTVSDRNVPAFNVVKGLWESVEFSLTLQGLI